MRADLGEREAGPPPAPVASFERLTDEGILARMRWRAVRRDARPTEAERWAAFCARAEYTGEMIAPW